MARIFMRDFLTLDLRTASKEIIHCDEEAGGNSLLVRVAATHAGIVNGNLRWYRPDKMMQGTSTWTDSGDYPKPVLAHHDEDSDPLGRVLNAKYHDLSYLYKNDYPILNDSVFYCSDAKKRLSTLESIDWVVENLSKLPGYKGLGFIELGLKVTNPDAIAKVNRKEYLTVSVGFATDSVICSICHQDWAVDDRCEHELGNTYDKKLCYVISGTMDFQEVSYVNTPADPFATTISVEKLTDRLSREFFLGLPLADQTKRAKASGVVLTDALYSSDIEMLGEQKMKLDLKAIADELRTGVNEERALALRKDLSDFKPETDTDKRDAKKLLSTVRAKIKSNGWGSVKPADVDAKEATDAISQEEKDQAAKELAASEAREVEVKDKETATTEKVEDKKEDKENKEGKDNKSEVSELVLSDSVAKIFTDEKCKDANESVKKVIADLEAAYAAITDQTSKRYLRYALCALTSSWYDREDFESWMNSLALEQDMIVIPKSEHDELTTAIDNFDNSEAELIKQRDAEENAKIRLMRQCKDSLATMVVMHKVLSGAKGFTDLKPEQITDAINKRSARDLSSLLDLRDEILEELQWAKPVSVKKPDVKEISDSAKLPSETETEIKKETVQKDSVEDNKEAKDEVPAIPMSRREMRNAAASARYRALLAED